MIERERISRILIDPGSSVNLMSFRTLKRLALDIPNLSPENVVIQGFNQNSQTALGSIILPLRLGSLETEVQFDVINADTSYRALLGRPWLHEHFVVPSTLHQCMKYTRDGEEKRIDGDIKPFAVHEIGYSDARYFIDASAAAQSSGSRGATPIRGRGRGRGRNNPRAAQRGKGKTGA